MALLVWSFFQTLGWKMDLEGIQACGLMSHDCLRMVGATLYWNVDIQCWPDLTSFACIFTLVFPFSCSTKQGHWPGFTDGLDRTGQHGLATKGKVIHCFSYTHIRTCITMSGCMCVNTYTHTHKPQKVTTFVTVHLGCQEFKVTLTAAMAMR